TDRGPLCRRRRRQRSGRGALEIHSFHNSKQRSCRNKRKPLAIGARTISPLCRVEVIAWRLFRHIALLPRRCAVVAQLTARLVHGAGKVMAKHGETWCRVPARVKVTIRSRPVGSLLE